MANFWKIVNNVISRSDIVLLVLDARFPEATRNIEVERKVALKGKKILYVANKCDLVPHSILDKLKNKFSPCVVVSSIDRFGGTLLLKKILELSRGENCVVGVLGYPNVGKSSVTNLLKGRSSAGVSSQAGHTKNIQMIVAKGKVRLLDTPGVLSYSDDDLLKQVTIGAVSPNRIKYPEVQAALLIGENIELFVNYLGFPIETDDPDMLDKIALKKLVLKKGGAPDTSRMAVQLINDWQKGKVHKKSFEENDGNKFKDIKKGRVSRYHTKGK